MKHVCRSVRSHIENCYCPEHIRLSPLVKSRCMCEIYRCYVRVSPYCRQDVPAIGDTDMFVAISCFGDD